MLMLHCGADEVPFDQLQQLETPEATKSHVPIPHFRVADLVRHALGYYGHQVVEEHHGVTEDGMRYFGLMRLRSDYGGYEDTVGLRNSHDKKFPIGISFGSRVFVCDNLSFSGDHVIKRRHTANAKRELPGLVMEAIEPLIDARTAQQRQFDAYKATPLSPELADHAIMQMYRQGVINVQRIAEVHQEWETPSFDDFIERNAWRMFNAATHVLSGRVVNNPSSTQALHTIIDGVCETID